MYMGGSRKIYILTPSKECFPRVPTPLEIQIKRDTFLQEFCPEWGVGGGVLIWAI